ncbi:ATP synthase F1 subunit gamma [bacterium]|nr:ATP synthase F1 subunit gamma [bacterium]
MATLRNIKERILSISNTQKITRAMKMVAAAKVKKAEAATKASRPFASELYSMINVLLENIDTYFDSVKTEKQIDNYPELLKKRRVDAVGFLVISSNKGLAGAYSSNIVRYTVKKIKQALAEGKKVRVYLVGQKALAPLNGFKKSLDFEIVSTYTTILDKLNASSASILAEDITHDYVTDKIDSLELITTRYKNMMTYKVEAWPILPLGGCGTRVTKFRDEDVNKKELHPLVELVPNPDVILKTLIPMYFTNIIYQALLEATASELASRMTAMSAAVNNASEMIRILTIDYNKARQAKITQELTEVISGANAVQ